ncbi:Zn-finger nucleic acid-binding protein [Cryobacterium sp. MP_3.1]|uniref:TFIIB-type zinc ribbon-containing protein n=1 Tax=Cryobacterium sp. MP_3.1 TaxID=3071711 RepID=UPI002DF9DE8B|nr:Zn-finger nucleic acid-binding protein [Cryobacterium sp. MP_3.1]
MNCPHDGAMLAVARRAGVEIDVCPICRGVWLDRGELDKVIALAGTRSRPGRPPSLPPLQVTSSASENMDTPPVSQSKDTAPRGENWLADLFKDTPPPTDRKT